MKQPLKENGGLPVSILWTLAIVAGISVANIYYVQPLLNMIRHELGESPRLEPYQYDFHDNLLHCRQLLAVVRLAWCYRCWSRFNRNFIINYAFL